jgi:hypothetical protein
VVKVGGGVQAINEVVKCELDLGISENARDMNTLAASVWNKGATLMNLFGKTLSRVDFWSRDILSHAHIFLSRTPEPDLRIEELSPGSMPL